MRSVASKPAPEAAWHTVIRGWWVTSRMEYLPDAVIHVVLPLLLVLRHEALSTRLVELSFWGLGVWLIGHWVGSSLNCLADYPVDRLDIGYKARLAEAIDQAGPRSILMVNLVEIVLATGASLWLAWDLQKPLLLLFWGAGLMGAYLYSFEPFRLKAKNLLNPATLTLIVYLTPLLFIYDLLSPVWNAYDLAVLLVYCLQMVPMFLVDEVSDHDEDQARNVFTPCVTYGRARVSCIANSIYISACAASLGLNIADTRTWSPLGVGLLCLATLAYLWVAHEFYLLARLGHLVSESTGSERELHARRLKEFSKTPAWLVATSLGALLLSLGRALA